MLSRLTVRALISASISLCSYYIGHNLYSCHFNGCTCILTAALVKQEIIGILILQFFHKIFSVTRKPLLLKEKHDKESRRLYLYRSAEDKRKPALMKIEFEEQMVKAAGRHFDEVAIQHYYRRF